MKILISHSGKQHAYHVAKALQDNGALAKFITRGYISSPFLQELILQQNNLFLRKRFEEGLSGMAVESNWKYEIPEFWARYVMKKSSTELLQLMIERDVAYDKEIASRLNTYEFDAFWGYNGSCLHGLRAAKNSNKLALCETQLAYLPVLKKILDEERRLHPEWADSIDYHGLPSSYEQKLIEEPQEADRVIAISQFLKNTLVEGGINAQKIDILPLGCPINHIRYAPKNKINRPLKLLFAGQISQRKGIKYALEAVKQFSKQDVEFHIIGNLNGSGNGLNNYKGLYTNHGPIAQPTLFSTYTDYDAMVFPSLAEGFPLVVVEAMAAGLPVITTMHTNANELIVHKKNGYIVPIRNVESIVESIAHLLALDNSAYEAMSAAARARAEEFSWATYSSQTIPNYIDKIKEI